MRRGNELLETTVEAYLSTRMRKIGGRTLKLIPDEKGVPDRLVIFPYGRMYFVEMKRPSGGVVLPAQKVWHDRSKQMGHLVHVLRSKQEVDDFIRWAANTGPGLKNGLTQARRDREAAANRYQIEEDLI